MGIAITIEEIGQFQKGQRIRNKFNGLTYKVVDILSASYEIKGEEPPYAKWLLSFSSEKEWEIR